MALTPTDIHHKEFKTSRFGGYNEEDVDAFLDLVADEFERLVQENGDIRQQMEHMKKRLSEFEEMQTSLQSALLAASKSAEAVKEQARQESESMLSKAQEESDSLMRTAQEQARQMMLAAQNDRQKIERAITTLQEVKKRYLESIKEMAEKQLTYIADWESRTESEGLVVEPATVEPVAAPIVQAPAHTMPKESEAPAVPPVTARVDAPADVPVVIEEPKAELVIEPPAAPGPAPVETGHKEVPEPPAAPVAREMREVAPPRRQPEQQRSQPAGPEEKVAPPSSNLVDEVLAMDSADESIFGEFDEEDGDPDDAPDKGRKGRKDKRDKHFFWE
ncbi:MAG: DivIVA domain-containing protein [Candidatus Geothermincolia bacterium]